MRARTGAPDRLILRVRNSHDFEQVLGDAQGEAPDRLTGIKNRRESSTTDDPCRDAIRRVRDSAGRQARAAALRKPLRPRPPGCDSRPAAVSTPTNGATCIPLETVLMVGKPPSTSTRCGAMPTSSCASRNAVWSSVVSVGSTRPPGNATCPRWLSTESERRMNTRCKSSSRCTSGTSTAAARLGTSCRGRRRDRSCAARGAASRSARVA